MLVPLHQQKMVQLRLARVQSRLHFLTKNKTVFLSVRDPDGSGFSCRSGSGL